MSNAKWIWKQGEIINDDYAEFVSSFETLTGKVTIKVSADTDYAVYVNNKLVGFEQYPTFPWKPVYDELKLHCKKGSNDLRILVYYNGDHSFSTYYSEDKPGLYFSILEDDKEILYSNPNILSRRSPTYLSGKGLKITNQMGFRMFYDSTKENIKDGFKKSVVVDKCMDFISRPNLKTKLYPRIENIKYLKNEKGHILLDLGKEVTGLLDLDFLSSKTQNIKICWGEHILDGGVRYEIQERRFITEYKAKRGHNKFLSTFRRYGLRYIELFFGNEITPIYLGIRPVFYPFKEKKWDIEDPIRKKIYETAIYTLKCCYHDHFEDCPWREQSYYILDSRNQFYYHRYVFKNKETIRSAIYLVNETRREDNIFGITIPSNMYFTIPSYCLYYAEIVYSYGKYFKDIQVYKDTYNIMNKMFEAFSSKIKHGIVQNFEGPNYWNFYDWVDGLDYPKGENKEDSLLNLIYICMLNFFKKICKAANLEFKFEKQLKLVKRTVKRKFFDKDKQMFFHSKENPRYYAYGNAVAILGGVLNKKESEIVAENIINSKEIIPSAIAMRAFTYEALYKVNKERYKNYILNDLDRAFSLQIKKGATTFYETELGDADFFGAGSLCHAWSALAIEFYNLYKIVK